MERRRFISAVDPSPLPGFRRLDATISIKVSTTQERARDAGIARIPARESEKGRWAGRERC
jgi:hypothetical protein